MNPKRFSISIPEPCSENWEQMTPCERGRFCGNCQKTVIDFTAWSDAALADFFVREENRNVCGRFYKHQIEDKVFSCTAPLKKHYWTLAMAASVAALTVVSATASAQAQKNTTHPSVSTPKKKLKQPAIKPAKNLKEVVVKSSKLEKPVVEVGKESYTLTGLVSAEIEKMPISDSASQVKNNVVLKKGRDGNELIIMGSPGPAKIIIIDGIPQPQKRNIFQRIGAWFRNTF